MEKVSKVILSNMCVCYRNDEILVINRSKSDWPGLSFPGGHVEDDEDCYSGVIREMKEETNLDIIDPILCGTIEWDWGNNTRYLALLYRCDTFSGELKSSNEGEMMWLKISDLKNYPWSTDFDKILDTFLKSLNKNNHFTNKSDY